MALARGEISTVKFWFTGPVVLALAAATVAMTAWGWWLYPPEGTSTAARVLLGAVFAILNLAAIAFQFAGGSHAARGDYVRVTLCLAAAVGIAFFAGVGSQRVVDKISGANEETLRVEQAQRESATAGIGELQQAVEDQRAAVATAETVLETKTAAAVAAQASLEAEERTGRGPLWAERQADRDAAAAQQQEAAAAVAAATAALQAAQGDLAAARGASVVVERLDEGAIIAAKESALAKWLLAHAWIGIEGFPLIAGWLLAYSVAASSAPVTRADLAALDERLIALGNPAPVTVEAAPLSDEDVARIAAEVAAAVLAGAPRSWVERAAPTPLAGRLQPARAAGVEFSPRTKVNDGALTRHRMPPSEDYSPRAERPESATPAERAQRVGSIPEKDPMRERMAEQAAAAAREMGDAPDGEEDRMVNGEAVR
ncbi:MAG: hypothetical protein AAFR16_01145 [Pseudomonadota bacterium]